jgi:hypothetical protein
MPKNEPVWKLPSKQWHQYRFHREGKPKHTLDIKWFGRAVYESEMVGAYSMVKDIRNANRRRKKK